MARTRELANTCTLYRLIMTHCLRPEGAKVQKSQDETKTYGNYKTNEVSKASRLQVLDFKILYFILFFLEFFFDFFNLNKVLRNNIRRLQY